MSFAAPLNSEAHPTLQRIEVASSLQIPNFHIVGLPSPEVAEARERIRAAIESSDFKFPKRRVVLNLSPASIKKRGTGLDLAMALAVIASSEEDSPYNDETSELEIVAWGELGLDGKLKPAGQLLRALYATWAAGIKRIILAHDEYAPALVLLDWMKCHADFSWPAPDIEEARDLREAWTKACQPFQTTRSFKFIQGGASPVHNASESSVSSLLPLAPALERTLGICSSGRHHVLLLGPKGIGKSHALDWLAAIQPPAHSSLLLEHALLSELQGIKELTPTRIFRRVSCHARPGALLGQSHQGLRPGEFGLAHGGLLVADELPEWSRDSREALREPLESGRVMLTRVGGSYEVKAKFLLAANGNLCPCGGWPEQLPKPEVPVSSCHCSPSEKRNYLRRLSGPILDRIDLISIVQPPRKNSPSVYDPARVGFLREKIIATQNQQISNWGFPSGLIPSQDLEALIQSHPKWTQAIEDSPTLSLRSRHKLVRVALSLAAWDGETEPGLGHWAESSYYRPERVGPFFNI